MTETDVTRPYTRVNVEMEAAVIRAREKLGPASYTDIAELTGLPERTVKYILVDLPRLRRIHRGEAKAEGSLRERILAAVKGMGQIKDVAEMRRILGMADDEHSVMHVLHSLHTAGKIDFTERGNGMGTATVVNIRLPKKGKSRSTDIVSAGIPFDQPPLPVVSREQEERRISEEHAIRVAREAIGPEATAPQASAPESDESAAYPLLTALLERERKRKDGDPKALAYVAAAEAIKDIDPIRASDLMAMAAEYDVPYPSPLEREYIAYVTANTGPDVDTEKPRAEGPTPLPGASSSR